MDIRLRPSYCLLAVRLCFYSMVFAASLTGNLELMYVLIPGALILLSVNSAIKDLHAVCALQLPVYGNNEEQTPAQKIILESGKQRRIEFTVSYYYCLWWIQILYLHSSQKTAIVVILPDSCSAQERRQLRQFLCR